MKQEPSARSAELRQLMQAFIDERLAEKLDQLNPDDPKYSERLEEYQFDNWIEKAARQVAYLQIATHIIKGVHPSAKGTNLLVCPDELHVIDAIGSHLLKSGYSTDLAVENAAALYVPKFLKLNYEGVTLLDLLLAEDVDLQYAFSKDTQQAKRLCDAFSSIARLPNNLKSSTLAKQIYWLVGDEPTRDADFHLLSPLYPSSLAHRVFQRIQHDRFSEEAKAARQARRENKFSATGHADYPNFATQKLGGTKPQNVSQLNSERGGNNYLLASLPPVWHARDNRPPLKVESVFPRFMRQNQPRWLMKRLHEFLLSNPPVNVHTRKRVDAYVDALIEELILFSAHLHQLEPGWSADPDCRLVEAEQLWLDPWRAELDEEFAARRTFGDWVEEVQSRFANQVNKVLSDLPAGDAEHREWSRRIDKKLNALREVLDV